MTGWRLYWIAALVAAVCMHVSSGQDTAVASSAAFGDLETMSFAPPTPSEQQKNQMDVLVIVGKVTATSARVLYEPLVNNESSITVSLVLQTSAQDHVLVKAFTHLQHQSFPYVAAYDDLVPNSVYFVHVQVGSAPSAVYTAVGRFRTPPRIIASEKLVLLTFSCDGFVNDADDSHWLTLAEEVRDPAYYGSVHMGDQIYADSILRTHQDATYDDIVNAFRAMYRRGFGRPLAQRVLRHGAHYMQFDDHEVKNNWSRDTWIKHNAFVRAGLQVFYEYQYQLLQDWSDLPPCRSATKEELYRPMHHQVSLGANELQLVFADTRLERELTELMSKTQLKYLQDAWSTNATQAVLFTSVPLFFHTQSSAAFAEYVDGDLYPGHKHFTSTVQALWDQLPSTGLQLVAGDLHMGHQSTISDSTKRVPQLIASGMTKSSTAMTDRRLKLFYYVITQWAQKVACAWSKLAVAGGQSEGYCMQSAPPHYGQNYGYQS
ncbi:hypothetical protein DYB32_009641 [Aphanomyces invadans]|uniref:PhoD-like phosphatase metallophosphatase domain-containing protein n=1 Tax=Aphanomyces invadans TaxID=157072 RepID=A0A3R6VEY3_9STRA|nr:hypothetical protein DYB32_009641 [Aphanomyces invadans]